MVMSHRHCGSVRREAPERRVECRSGRGRMYPAANLRANVRLTSRPLGAVGGPNDQVEMARYARAPASRAHLAVRVQVTVKIKQSHAHIELGTGLDHDGQSGRRVRCRPVRRTTRETNHRHANQDVERRFQGSISHAWFWENELLAVRSCSKGRMVPGVTSPHRMVASAHDLVAMCFDRVAAAADSE